MTTMNKVILAGNLDSYQALVRRSSPRLDYRQTTGRDHAPALSITDDLPEAGGGGGSSTGAAEGQEVAASDDDDASSEDGDPDPRPSSNISPPSGKRRVAAAKAGTLPHPQVSEIALWRLPTVLAHIPVSRSHWWAGVAEGRYPAPVKLSKRCVAWRSSDIRNLIASF